MKNEQKKRIDKLTEEGSPLKDKRKIPAALAARLPRYFRCLRTMLLEGSFRTSSGELAERMNTTAAQVRSDLGYFDSHGQQGYGYSVKPLYTEISRALGTAEGYRAVFLGGTPGESLADEALFGGRGIRLCACFSDALYEREAVGSVTPVYPLEELEGYLASNPTEIAVLSPHYIIKEDFLERMKAAGVRGILNLSPAELPKDRGVAVINLMIGDLLMMLGAMVLENGRKEETEE